MPSGKAIATEIVTATSTRAIVCIEAVQRPIAQQKPRAPAASRPTRQPASAQASTATRATSAPAGRAVRTSCTAARTAWTTALIPAKSGWRLVFSQSTPGATRAPGEKVNGGAVVIRLPSGL